jgi:glucan phosphoethanolaminetransferase (alkaline phosphatase superfamily)
MCEHARRALARVQHRDTTLNKEVIELKTKLGIEAIWYDMQVKISKTNSRLLAFSWVFFVVFLAVFWGNFYGVSKRHMSYKRLPWKIVMTSMFVMISVFVTLKPCNLCIGKLCNV